MRSLFASRAPSPEVRTLEDRVKDRLVEGGTVAAVAASENISLALATIIVEDLGRRGLVSPAESLCASGLGACGSGESDEIALHCAGCPLIPMRVAKA